MELERNVMLEMQKRNLNDKNAFKVDFGSFGLASAQ